MEDGKVVIGVSLNAKDFDREISHLETKLNDLEEDYKILERENPFDGQEEELRKLSSEIVATKKKIQQLNNEKNKISQTGFQGIQQSVENVGKSVTKTIGKMGRWALAVFGIRTAYNAIRNAINVISAQDDQLAADIEYMKNALAYTLEPVVRAIVNLAKQLMFYVGYIVKAWTGKNIFENANKSLGGATKNAKALNKEISKTLASGIDEITNLDTSTGGGGGADTGGGGAMPSFDLSQIQGDVPEWVKWIADNGDLVIAIIGGIAGALGALKLGFGGLKSLGIGLMIFSIIKLIQDFLKYLKDPSWKNFGKIIQDIGLFIIGLGVAFLGLPAVIVGVIVLIVGTIIKYWEEIKAFFQGIIDWLTGKSDWVHDMFGDTIGAIYDTFVNVLQGILDGFDSLFSGIKEVFDGIIKFIKGIFSGNWEEALQGLGQIFAGFTDIIVGLMKIAWSGLIEGAKLAWNGIKSAFSAVGSFFGNLVKTILGFFKNIGVTVGNIIGSAFKGVINGVLWAIENILNSPIRTINALIGVINKVPGINLGRLSTFKLPRLARGGIVNNPGPGVMMGNYVAGERGAEAVLPIENSSFIKGFAKMVADNMQNDSTDLLIELNRNVLEMANKPTILNINGKEVAQAIHTDLRNEDNRVNTSHAISIK